MKEERDPEPSVQGGDHQFLEPGEHEDFQTEHRMRVRIGEKEEDVYTEEGREELVSDDAIKPWEEGFAEGADHGGSLGICAHCENVLGDRKETIVQKEYDSETWFFCCDGCANAGLKKKE